MGGNFVTIGGTNRSGLARLEANGTVDLTFNPAVGGGVVYCVAAQPDGKLLVGGDFTTLGGPALDRLGRLNANGSLDTNFPAGVAGVTSPGVVSLGLQADGKILVGGNFTTLGGQPRSHLGRLNADGSVDSSFTAGASDPVGGVAIQADGRILVGGAFTNLAGQPRNRLGRLTGVGPASESLSIETNAPLRVRWTRTGTSPELEYVTFEQSTDGTNYTSLGNGGRLGNVWSVSVASFPQARHFCVRARGRAVGGYYNGSRGLIESVRQFYLPLPASLTAQPQSQTVPPGANVVLSVAATGKAPLTYQWHKNGLPLADGGVISGATPPSLTLTSVQFADSGNYSVVVRNVDGAVVSRTAVVAVTLVTARDGFNPEANGTVETIAVQADGRIVVGGYFTSLRGQSCTNLGRLNPDGSLDTSFTASANSAVMALLVQTNGKILMGGQFTELCGQSRLYFGRLNPDGSLDTTFNLDANTWVSCLVAQADGRILVGGAFTILGGQSRSRVARLAADGTLDPFFNPGADNPVYCLAPQADGRILVGGQFTTFGGQPRERIAQLHPDGSLDVTFNPQPDGVVRSLAVQPDGGILVGGSFTSVSGQPRLRMARLHADGSLDPAFNPDAIHEPNPASTSVKSLVVQADGKVLVGGFFTKLGGQTRNHLARLNPDGSLDATFNPGAGYVVSCLTVQTDGKILVGGNFTTLGGQPCVCLGRLNPDGSLETDFNPETGLVQCLAVQPDGRIVVGGFFGMLGGQPCMHIGRLNANASLDTSFNPGADYWVNALAVQGDGRIVVGGGFTTLGGKNRSRIGRLNPDGNLDATFDPGADDIVYSLALQPDGRILVGGRFLELGGQPRTNLARLNADGSLDATFNASAIPCYVPYFLYYGVLSLALQPDGRILVGGAYTNLCGQTRNYLGRLNADGSLDSAFNPGADNPVCSLAVQADGRILVGGVFTSLGGQPRSGLGRLQLDGSLDTTFNPRLSAAYGPTVCSLAVQADGKIVVAGYFTAIGGQSRAGLARLNPDGSVEPAFNPGVSDPDFEGVYSLALQADGKIVVGGSFTNLCGQPRMGIARLTPLNVAVQRLDLDAPTATATWQRGGAGPEIDQVHLGLSYDGLTYATVSQATRVSGGWRFAGLDVPTGRNIYLRARGRTVGGYFNTSSGLIESVRQAFVRPNTTPQLSGLADLQIQTPLGIPTETIAFTVGDGETDPSTLTCSAVAADASLVSGFAFGGSGHDRTLVITPTPGRRGSTLVSVTVSDGLATTTQSFLLSVGLLPGDINNDGVVDPSELEAVLQSYWPYSPWLQMTNPASLGGGLLQFSLADAGAWLFSVEASTNLVDWEALPDPAWPVYQFWDPPVTNAPTRFYRLRWP